jgi:hypothetical protein
LNRKTSAGFRKREILGYSICEAPPNSHLHDWRKMEVCSINLNKGEDDKGPIGSIG